MVWTGYGDDVKGMAGCGVYGYESSEWTGVKPETLAWWVAKLQAQHEETYSFSSSTSDGAGGWKDEVHSSKATEHDIDVPDVFRKLPWGKALRFNQGDAFFAAQAGVATPGTAPGEAAPAVMSQIIPFLFPKDGEATPEWTGAAAQDRKDEGGGG